MTSKIRYDSDYDILLVSNKEINEKVKRNFVFDDITGRVQIQFGYPDFTDKTADKSEFEFKIQEIIPFGDKNLSKQEHHEINEFLKTEYNLLAADIALAKTLALYWGGRGGQTDSQATAGSSSSEEGTIITNKNTNETLGLL